MPSAPELLAPAGDWDCVRAAIENGADAVYFGLDTGFNARARATNFAVADLPRLTATLHRRGLKGYATVNTLVFSDELPQFEQLIVAVAEAGVDAVLVQDVGAARLIRAICPDLPLHASTQMTLTSAESIRLAEQLGMERVVVARELSIDEIVAIRRETSMPLEVFVHGALCVAYSGQCLTSESLGGRSANRGQCAQACRLPYDLVCDGKDVDLGDQKYLLSPQDLAAYALAPELIAAGIASFKIEGRLKTPEYVANITKHYRTAIDAAVAAQPVAFTSRDVEEMELSFSRGFSPGWLQGCDHKMLVPATSSAKRGVKLGTVVAVRRGRAVVDLVAGVKRGDGVAFDCGQPVDDPEGGRVYEVFQGGESLTEAVASGQVELTFGHGAVDFDNVQPGQTVWKTDDPHLTARLRKTFASTDPVRRMPIDLHVTVATGGPVRIVATTSGGDRCEIESDEPTVAATKHSLTAEALQAQLARLGGTPFELKSLTADITGGPMVPHSVLGKLRHELVARLEEAVVALPPRRINRGVLAKAESGQRRADSGEGKTEMVALHVLVRSLSQLRDVLELGERSLYADFADIRQYREAVELAHAHAATIHLATPRIQKPDELGIFRLIVKAQPDGVLVRNVGGLLIGAVETTSHAVCNAVEFFLAHPGLLAAAREAARSADKEQLDGHVFEALRFSPTFPYFFRTVTAPTVLGRGEPHELMLEPGETVIALSHAAMFDERAVSAPETFDPQRGLTANFVFGLGIHECLGRAIGAVMIPEIVRQAVLLDGLETDPIDTRGGPVPEAWKWRWRVAG